jgi:hypothetical protein
MVVHQRQSINRAAQSVNAHQRLWLARVHLDIDVLPADIR